MANAFQNSAFQKTPDLAFQASAVVVPITVVADSGISGGTWTKGRWRKFIGEIESEKEAERVAAETKVRKARELDEANIIVAKFHEENRRGIARREAAERSKALTAQHAIASAHAAHNAALQMQQQFHTMHLAHAAARQALAARDNDDESALIILLDAMDH